MKVRVEKLGVAGGRRARWTVPLPGVEAEAGKGERIATCFQLSLLDLLGPRVEYVSYTLRYLRVDS